MANQQKNLKNVLILSANIPLLLFAGLLLLSSFSCSKQSADKDAAIHDSLRTAQSADTTEQALRLGDTSDRPLDRMPGAAEVEIGNLPLLHSSVLAQFHPNPPGYQRYRSLAYDTTGRSESVSFFRAHGDSTKLIRCIIVDQDERTASTLVKQIIEVKAQGFREFEASGTKVRAYYTEINGAPAIYGHNPTTRVATLNILCGDHRLVLFREDKANSTDQLIAIAKTMDLKRLTEMVPQ
jgi:hypothetical protein